MFFVPFPLGQKEEPAAEGLELGNSSQDRVEPSRPSSLGLAGTVGESPPREGEGLSPEECSRGGGECWGR